MSKRFACDQAEGVTLLAAWTWELVGVVVVSLGQTSWSKKAWKWWWTRNKIINVSKVFPKLGFVMMFVMFLINTIILGMIWLICFQWSEKQIHGYWKNILPSGNHGKTWKSPFKNRKSSNQIVRFYIHVKDCQRLTLIWWIKTKEPVLN